MYYYVEWKYSSKSTSQGLIDLSSDIDIIRATQSSNILRTVGTSLSAMQGKSKLLRNVVVVNQGEGKATLDGLCSSALSEVNLTRHDARHLCTRLPTYTRAPFLRGFMISLHQSNECIQSTRRVTAITGGLGGIGILVGKSRLHSGSSLNTLLSRSGRTCKADFASMCSPSVYGLVKVACCDATTKEYISCVHNLRRFLQFLSGVQSFETDILHASGELHDATFDHQTSLSLSKVLAPKMVYADAVQSLVSLLPNLNTVFFSSISVILASPGQTNYTAANSYLDALASTARLRGYRATSLQWGAWEASDGMADGFQILKRNLKG